MPAAGTPALSSQFVENFASGGSPVEAVAAAGSVIANATQLSASARIHTVSGADDTKGVVLPATVAGVEHRIYSEQATNGLKLYPPVNSTLNGGTANSALVMEGKTGAICFATNATNWAVIFTLNS